MYIFMYACVSCNALRLFIYQLPTKVHNNHSAGLNFTFHLRGPQCA